MINPYESPPSLDSPDAKKLAKPPAPKSFKEAAIRGLRLGRKYGNYISLIFVILASIGIWLAVVKLSITLLKQENHELNVIGFELMKPIGSAIGGYLVTMLWSIVIATCISLVVYLFERRKKSVD